MDFNNKDVKPGGWVAIFVLAELGPEEIFKAKVQACVATWVNIRRMRKEPIFPKIDGTVLQTQSSSLHVYRIWGATEGTVEETVPMLQELVDLIGNIMGAKHMEAHVGGNIFTRVLVPSERPMDYKLN